MSSMCSHFNGRCVECQDSFSAVQLPAISDGRSAMVVRVLYMIWILGFFGLLFFSIADTLFGAGSFAIRLANLPYRILISIVWPFAIVTPRGRYLLWARWRS